MRTSLGEEGAEPLIGVGSFTLFSKITIRLAVSITSVTPEPTATTVLVGVQGLDIPEFRVPSNIAVMVIF